MRFCKLAKYKSEASTTVPFDYHDQNGLALGYWVAKFRRQKVSGELSEEALDSIFLGLPTKKDTFEHGLQIYRITSYIWHLSRRLEN